MVRDAGDSKALIQPGQYNYPALFGYGSLSEAIRWRLRQLAQQRLPERG